MEYKMMDRDELRKMIYTSWYSRDHQKGYDNCWGIGKAKKDYLSRELIVIPINDNHRALATIYFSLSGSPPKGRAILLLDYKGIEDKTFYGDLLLIGRKNKWITKVGIKLEDGEKLTEIVSLKKDGKCF